VSTVTAETVERARYAEWSALVAQSPDGCIYAQPEYLDALTRATGARYRIIGIRRAGVLVGGVALYETESRLLGRRAGPRLLLYYHGPVRAPYPGGYPSERTARDVEALTALAEHLRGLGHDQITLKSRSTLQDVRPFLSLGWTAYPS